VICTKSRCRIEWTPDGYRLKGRTAKATLKQGRRVYARGKAVRSRGKARALVRPIRPTGKGRYTLRIGSRRTTRVTLR
jgi:hypothetical protein